MDDAEPGMNLQSLSSPNRETYSQPANKTLLSIMYNMW